MDECRQNSTPMRVIEFCRHVHRFPLKNALLLSLLNQFISSGGNFAVGVYLARALPLREYGLYGICYGICMLYIGVGNAIILTQMLVNMAEVDVNEQSTYASKMLLAVLFLGMMTVGMVVLGLLIAFLYDPATAEYFSTICVVAVTSILFLCKEFFIRYAYVMRIEKIAVCVSGYSLVILAVGLLLEHLAGITLTVNHVLLLSAVGTAIGALAGYWSTPLHVLRHLRAGARDFVTAWHQGRWALGGVVVTWLQSQTYTYVLAVVLGPAGVGQANAARIFISPFSFLLPAINQIALPRLADLRQNQPERLLRMATLLTLGLFILAVIYSILLLHSLSVVSALVLGRDDPGVQSLVWIWCVVVANQMILQGGSALLQVLRQFRILTLLNLVSAAAAISSAFLLIQLLGAPGAIWAVAVGEVLLSILVWREIRGDHGRRR